MDSTTTKTTLIYSTLYLALIIASIYYLQPWLIPHNLISLTDNVIIKKQPDLPLRFNAHGTFKILQVADLHYGNGIVTRCRDVLETEFAYCSDLNSTRFLKRLIEDENPDFIAFTGDNIFGSSTPDAAESLFGAFGPAIESRLPWAAVLGNHDQESTMTREELMYFISLMDYSVSQTNPTAEDASHIDGFGNYYVQLQGPPGSHLANHSIFNLYFLDSGDSEIFEGRKTYSWIKDSQLRWLHGVSKTFQTMWQKIKKACYDSSSSSSSEDEMEDYIITQMIKKKKEKKKESSSRQTNHRDHMQGHQNLFNDYFSESPSYSENIFRRRFRMRRSLFLRIQSAVETHEPYFQQKRNAANKLGLSALQKITASLRMLAYGVTGDLVDEYVKIGETTANESLKMFVKTNISLYGNEYLRSPNSDDIARLLEIGNKRDFPGMLGSIDCMHWKWKNCPAAWKGMYSGKSHEPTIILEAVASYDLWIWHAFFGLPGSNNDINVLEHSYIFSELAQGRAPPANYSINDHNYKMGYYLADGIYPPWATFVKTIPQPLSNKKKYFAMRQESTRKDVERAFGVLQARFAIVRGPARFFHEETLKNIMMACIILHNMIVEDERDLHIQEDISSMYDQVNDEPIEIISDANSQSPALKEFIQSHYNIRDRAIHLQLQADLIDHLWNKYSMS